MNLLFITENKRTIENVILELEFNYEIAVANNLESTVSSLLSCDIDYVFIDNAISKLKDFEILKLIQNLASAPKTVLVSTKCTKEIKQVLNIEISHLDKWCPELIKKVLNQTQISRMFFDLIKLDTKKMIAYFQEQEIHLTEIEMKILMLFISNPERLFSKEDISKFVWNSHVKSRHNLATHLYNLKEKLPILKKLIINARGRGYYLKTN